MARPAVFAVVVVFHHINPPCAKCAAMFWLQIWTGSFPALEGPSLSTWLWWCIVGSCRLRHSPRNFSPYILHCCSVQDSGLLVHCSQSRPLSIIRSGNRHGFVLHSLLAKQIWSSVYCCMPAGVWSNFVPNLHSGFRSLTLSLTYKDCPLDKRGLRRTQICHLVRWVRTPGTWACGKTGYPAVFVSSKHIFLPASWQGSGSASSRRCSRQTPSSSRPWGTCGRWSDQTERRSTRSLLTRPACKFCFDLIHHHAWKEL